MGVGGAFYHAEVVEFASNDVDFVGAGGGLVLLEMTGEVGAPYRMYCFISLIILVYSRIIIGGCLCSLRMLGRKSFLHAVSRSLSI